MIPESFHITDNSVGTGIGLSQKSFSITCSDRNTGKPLLFKCFEFTTLDITNMSLSTLRKENLQLPGSSTGETHSIFFLMCNLYKSAKSPDPTENVEKVIFL